MLVSNKQRCLCKAMRMTLTVPLNKLVTSTNETCTERTFSSGCSHLQQSATELQITNSLLMFRCICFNSLQRNCRSPTVCRCSAVSVSTICNGTTDHQQSADGQHHRNITSSEFLADASQVSSNASRGCR